MALKTQKGTPTQRFVPIEEVRDGIAILKGGGMRAVVLVSSINLALKSQDEQRAVLQQFQTFLNTLDFSLQIYIQSRELNIRPYLDTLRAREPQQDNDLMKVQLREYIQFVEHFTSEVDIMTKSFFMVVPYSPTIVNVKGGLSSLLKREKQSDEKEKARFEEHRTQIEQRISVVQQGLARIGLRTITLGTDEVVELFYHIFNPGEGEKALPQT